MVDKPSVNQKLGTKSGGPEVKINLIGESRKRVVLTEMRARKFFRGALAMCGVIAVGLAGVVYYRVWVGNRLSETEAEVRASEARLASFEEVAIEGLELGQRLEGVRRILAGRELLPEKMNLFFEVFESGIDVSFVDFGSTTEQNRINFGGGVADVGAFVNFNERVNGLAEERGYGQVELESLARGSTADYQFTYNISVGKAEEGE